MKQGIIDYIKRFVKEYENRDGIFSSYGEPVVGFADAHHPFIQSLPEIISPTHELPQNVLPDAGIIVAYFVPFTREIAQSNRNGCTLASPEWARSYEETNAMFAELNEGLINFIHSQGGAACITPKAVTFNQELLVSDWSHRHIAYAAGLGTFGINNMLITRSGCCGRISTVITNLKFMPDEPLKEELCIYKKNGACGVCVKNCPTGALLTDSYDRHKCYALCQENAKVYTDFGSSYTNEDGTGSNSVGSDVCGKCVTASPCAFWKL